MINEIPKCPINYFKDNEYPKEIINNIFEGNKVLKHIIIYDSFPNNNVSINNQLWKMSNMIFKISFIDMTGSIIQNRNEIYVYGEDLEHYIHKVMHKKNSFIYNYMIDNMNCSQTTNHFRLSQQDPPEDF